MYITTTNHHPLPPSPATTTTHYHYNCYHHNPLPPHWQPLPPQPATTITRYHNRYHKSATTTTRYHHNLLPPQQPTRTRTRVSTSQFWQPIVIFANSLVAGSGFGSTADVWESGNWSVERFGLQPMPFDGFLLLLDLLERVLCALLLLLATLTFVLT